MAFDEHLADRVRGLLLQQPALSERKMFGGLCFMLGGNMACGIMGQQLMLRVGPDAYEQTVKRPHARPMDFTGRPMKGMIYVDPKGFNNDSALQAWLQPCVDFAGQLPPKVPKPKAPRFPPKKRARSG